VTQSVDKQESFLGLGEMGSLCEGVGSMRMEHWVGVHNAQRVSEDELR